jgi:hypothetical protein
VSELGDDQECLWSCLNVALERKPKIDIGIASRSRIRWGDAVRLQGQSRWDRDLESLPDERLDQDQVVELWPATPWRRAVASTV